MSVIGTTRRNCFVFSSRNNNLSVIANEYNVIARRVFHIQVISFIEVWGRSSSKQEHITKTLTVSDLRILTVEFMTCWDDEVLNKKKQEKYSFK